MDASYLAFLNLNLEARTRAYAATVASRPRAQEFEELLGPATHQGNSAFGSEHAQDPNEDKYEAINEAWLSPAK
jgi:hypothetical protein